MNRLPNLPLQVPRARGGVTLTEVLMSLLIMSIGVVSLVTLFPISTLRVIEATNMTNATVLRYNVEAIIDSQPFIVFNPDSNPMTSHAGTNYVVDPLGYITMTNIGGTPGVFGYNAPPTVNAPLPTRFVGTSLVTNLDQALAFVSSADTFTDWGSMDVSGPPTATSVTLASGLDLSAIAGTGLTDVRVTLFENGLNPRSEVRYVDSISPTAPHTLTWTTPLPAGFGSPVAPVARAHVQMNESFYSWMLSVNQTIDGAAKIYVVVFVKRAVTQASEQVYTCKLLPTLPGSTAENNTATVIYTGTKPEVRRGGYLFDTKNCRWYRISSVAPGTTNVVLETSIQRSNTEDLNRNNTLDAGEDANGNGILDEGGVIVFPNVVGVFPLELKVPQ